MKRQYAKLIVISMFALSARPQPTLGAELPPALREVRFDQRLNDQVPLDLEFVDETGRPVQLGDYFGEKPVILVLAYFECPMLCTQVLNGLVRGMLDMPYTVGQEFNVVTVSFDPRETPTMAAAKRKTYLERYGRPGAAEGWHFLTGQQKDIAALTDAVGFHYTYDAQRGQFAHASGILLLTSDGKISRYFYDISYPGRRFAVGSGRGLGGQDRFAGRADIALLLSLRSDRRHLRRGGDELRACRRPVDRSRRGNLSDPAMAKRPAAVVGRNS